MTKNQQRIEEWTKQQVALAKGFTACLYLGYGKYDRRESATLEEARQHRETMNKEYKTHQKVMIYAITGGVEQTVFIE